MDSTAVFQRLIANKEGNGRLAIVNDGTKTKLVYFWPSTRIAIR